MAIELDREDSELMVGVALLDLVDDCSKEREAVRDTSLVDVRVVVMEADSDMVSSRVSEADWDCVLLELRDSVQLKVRDCVRPSWDCETVAEYVADVDRDQLIEFVAEASRDKEIVGEGVGGGVIVGVTEGVLDNDISRECESWLIVPDELAVSDVSLVVVGVPVPRETVDDNDCEVS